MKHIGYVVSFVCGTVLLSACSNITSTGAGGMGSSQGSQRYVHLSVPLQAAPLNKIYVLNATSTQQVAYWTLVKNSLPGVNPPPFPYFSLPLNQGETTTFNLVVPKSSSHYTGCSLTFDQNGKLINQSAQGACQGAVYIPNQNYQYHTLDSLVTVYNLGANFGNPVTVSPGILKEQVTSNKIVRTITFVNKSNRDVCIVNQISGNSNAAPTPSQMCSGPYQTKVLSGASTMFPVPSSGLNSAAWIIAGYRTPGTGTWLQTGFAGSKRQQAATKVELTMFPYYASGNSGPIKYSVGPTNIDISSVDGANLTYKFYPSTQPGTGVATPVCTLANNNVNPATQYTGVYSAANPISYFANTSNNGAFACNSTNVYKNGNGTNVGCASPCSMAYVNYVDGASRTEIDQKCCIGNYATKATCVSSSNPNNPANSWYTALIHQQFINSYSFAYDDAKADFTCDPFASYVFEIDGIGSAILSSN